MDVYRTKVNFYRRKSVT